MDGEGESFLSDLDNEKTGEQIVFEQRVFRANETFRQKVNCLINWHISPSESCIYPAEWNKNWSSFKRHACLFEYDSHKKVLYKKVKCSDGIGMYNFLPKIKSIFWNWVTVIL